MKHGYVDIGSTGRYAVGLFQWGHRHSSFGTCLVDRRGVALSNSAQSAVWALLIGGMFIYPVGLLICKLLGGRGTHTKGNPLGQLAGASTFWLIFCLPVAYALGLQNPSWFFSAMLLIIGGRYLVFATLYGMRLYWILGLALAAAGFALAMLNAPAHIVAIAGAAIEAVFAVICIVQHRR